MNSKVVKFREILSRPGTAVIPGCYECISAKLIEQAGFEAGYITGYGLTASLLGLPDFGMISMTELVGQAGNVSRSVEIPLLCDGEDGFGGPFNMARAAMAFRDVGIAAIHIEDQVAPKKCAAVRNEVVPIEQMADKIRVAKRAVGDDVVIIARTDSKHLGLAEVIKRLNAYAEAGADCGMIPDPCAEAELAELGRNVQVPMCVFAGLPGFTNNYPLETFERAGMKMVIFPVNTLLASAKVSLELLQFLREEKTLMGTFDKLMEFKTLNTLLGWEAWSQYEGKELVYTS